MPKDLIKLEEIPKWAGLIYIGGGVEIIKNAPFMHKVFHSRSRVVEKFARVMQERLHLGKCALTIKNEEINSRKRSLTEMP